MNEIAYFFGLMLGLLVKYWWVWLLIGFVFPPFLVIGLIAVAFRIVT